MSSRQIAPALLLCAWALLLGGCQRNDPPPTVIVAPGPAGEPGKPGATGEPGRPGDATVIVLPPAASAASANPA